MGNWPCLQNDYSKRGQLSSAQFGLVSCSEGDLLAGSRSREVGKGVDDLEGVNQLLEDGVVGRKVLGKHSPLTACFHHIHDCIHNLPKRVFSLPLLRIQDNFCNLPLFISEVS